ncbi:MAG TPA: capsule assembly Wzi family protein [Candidatus Acidoferrum sp.]|nr:capsule assembly Wzi family protein [Candidatus Acidoferrum sp.]
MALGRAIRTISAAVAALGILATPVRAATPQSKEKQTAEAPANSGAASPKKGENASLKPSQQAAADAERNTQLGLSLVKNLAHDQKAIWTSPAHIRLGEATWLVPFAGITAGFLVTDRDASLHLLSPPTRLRTYTRFSNYGIAGVAGAGAGLYLLGEVTDDAHKREAGLLSGEAALDALAVTTALKYATGRERPNVDSYHGKFWQGGDSFPSDHAATAWAIASVLSHEYPGPLTKIFAYGAATAITYARVRGQQHFPADVLVGSGIGWLTGWQVYRAHHNVELGGGVPEDLSDMPLLETDRTPRQMGSPYVPLDSWVYPLFDRLIAAGVINDAILGMRPWTRLECARLVSEAGDQLQDASAQTLPVKIYDSLRQEFLPEISLLAGGSNRAVHLESAYSRITQISGPPLTDGYHFGQTLYNDFGRPFQEGFNSVAGFSGWASDGRWVVYARGEFQHAPAGPQYSPQVQTALNVVDDNPGLPAGPQPQRNQARLLDAYVGLNLADWQLSFGQESQWWGPEASGPLLFSDNAAPLRMFHIDRVTPFRLPWFGRYLGPMRWDAFFGRLQGNLLSPAPYFHGEKISFKPTPNLEFGFTRTVEVGGAGRPFTPYRLFLTYFSATSYFQKTAQKDPGKRDGGFEFSYRLPYLRNWLTLYSDSISADDPSPLAAPRRAGFVPGLYLTHFPRIQKLDLRVEAPLTDTVSTNFPGRYIYWDNYYHDLYTNRRFLMGNWAGRDGAGIQAWSRYWLTPKNSIQLGYRHLKVDNKMIPNGGTVNDASMRVDYWLRPDIGVTASAQYEQWTFPLLAPGLQKNFSTSLQILYWPAHGRH